MRFHHLLLSVLTSFLNPYAYGYWISIGYQLDQAIDSYVASSYTVISYNDDPQDILADIMLYSPPTATQMMLSEAILVVRNEQWLRPLANISYPDPGLYTVRLVETSAKQNILAESQTFVPPGFGGNSSDSTISSFSVLSSTSTIPSSIPFSAFSGSALPNISYSSWPWYHPMPSASSTYVVTGPTTYRSTSERFVEGPPIAAIIGGVLGAFFTLILSFVILLCRRRRNRFQKLKREDSLVPELTPMSSQYPSSFFKPYEAQDRLPQISSTESSANPFSGGIHHPLPDDPVSVMSPSAPTNPAILEELNSLRNKIKDLEQLQRSMPESSSDSKNGSTSLFLSYQHSGTESLPHYDSVNDTNNLYGHQSHTTGSKTQCFCSSCSV